MQFYGADTTALREHAERTGQGAQRLARACEEIFRLAHAAGWQGADAETFRADCDAVSRTGLELSTSLDAFGRELHGHADEQDSASGLEGEGLGGLLTELLGGPLGSLLGFGGAGDGLGSPFLGMSASAAGIATGFAGGGFGGAALQHGMGTPIDPATFEPESGSSTTHGGSVKSGNTTHEGSVTEHDDGSTTYSYGVSEERKLKVGSEETGGSATLSIGETASVTEHPDGSLTVTFDASVEGGVEFHGQVKGVEGGIESGVTGKGSFSVTLPPGSSPADAEGINPYDPDTIPPGASVTVTGELSASVGASLGYRDIATGKLGISGSEEMVSTISRGYDGSLIVDQGPGSTQGINAGLQIGPDHANVTIEGSSALKTTTLEHTEFDGSAEGRTAFDAYMFTGEQPDAGSPGVGDSYTDTIKSVSTDTSITGTVGDGNGTETSVGASTETATIYDVQRTYSDGSWVREHRYSPLGEGGDDAGGPYGVTHTSSDGPTHYELRFPQSGTAPPSSYNELYGNAPYTFGEDQVINVQLTETEMEQIIENRGKGETPEEVLNAYATAGPEGARQMAEDHSSLGDGGPPVAPGVVTDPGAEVDPGQRGGYPTGGTGSKHATPTTA
ncbi:hypothetical protein H3H54_11275 [Brachybacterium sp. Z12]|uniref:WXG100 family type VII secretion target n=1 Tax=Brachybacterium sp. Z12 TaxID=2759167 RepID=UPI00185F8A39|nr:hypothetical protein [Brachybacterium sp. Z12]QNN81889.1 hypothetical protein H3H54_11275 [Brachybacterium sp. Z12]